MKKGDLVRYKKTSFHSDEKLKVGTIGTIIQYIDNPTTKKAVVDFEGYGIAIVPVSYIELLPS